MLSHGDQTSLREAVKALESPGFIMRLANWVGLPVESLVKRLPAAAQELVGKTVNGALAKCMEVALYRTDSSSSWLRSESAMKWTVAATGAAAGAFGLGALAVELPVTTTVMLRSIAEIARAEGENITTPEARVACLEVLALGGGHPIDEVSKASYFAIRAALAREVTEALEHLAARQTASRSAPALVRLVESIGARFGVVVSEKAAAGAIPVIGALGGATVNALFMDHFQDVAHAHFTVRRLERHYGPDLVRAAYEQHLREMKA